MRIILGLLLAVAPAVFAPGVISTGDDESHPAFTPDGKTMYFIKNTPDFAYWTICVSRLVDGKWTTPEVAPFSGQYRDADPFITADGKHFLFISSRPFSDAPKRDLDIWMMDRKADGTWSEPRRAGGEINSEANEWFPTMTGDGTIYFGSERAGGKGGADIWSAKLVEGRYGAVENVAAINSEAGEFEPLVTADGKSVIVAVNGRPDGLGGFDLYASTRTETGWTPLKHLGKEINTPFWEFAPKLSPDGKTFYFASNRRAQQGPRTKRLSYSELLEQIRGAGNGLRDIYAVDAEFLGFNRM
jgi:Tol biopolymer transport system component